MKRTPARNPNLFLVVLAILAAWVSGCAQGPQDLDDGNSRDDREVVLDGETAGAPWRLVTFQGEDGETCLATQDVENEFAICNVSLERHPGGRYGFIDWSYGSITGAEATLIAGLAAPQVGEVTIRLQDGRELQARMLDEGYPLLFFVKDIPEVVRVRNFIARDADGEVLERTPG